MGKPRNKRAERFAVVNAEQSPQIAHVFDRRGNFKPDGEAQQELYDAIGRNTVTFAFGPAGVGKTHVAVAAAVERLHNGQVDRIVLARPAVEAGERLGMLPGGIDEKIDPYMQPLYDVLLQLMDGRTLKRERANKRIEIAPLAFMRGRTFSRAAIIVDEAQNATRMQLKMALTRIGHGSNLVLCGDPSQADNEGGKQYLTPMADALEGVPGLAIVDMAGGKIVRHSIVTNIVQRLEERAI